MSAYTPTGKPETGSRNIAEQVRDEFELIEAGFNAISAGSFVVPYEERANTSTTIGASDRAKAIRITGTGNSTQAFSAVATLAAGWWTLLWNDTTGYVSLTADGATWRMYPGEERYIYADITNSILRSRSVRGFKIKTQTAGAGTFVVPARGGRNALWVRCTGGGQGGGGGGGGGAGRGINTSGGHGGGGGSGGAAGQNGQTVQRRIPWEDLPAAGTSIDFSVGAAGAKGTGGAGGTGATSGNSGGNGVDGTSGSAGGDTTFGTSSNAYYVIALGGTAGTNKGLLGEGGGTTPAGGAAVTNSASVTAAAISNHLGGITTANSVGPASTAGTSSSSGTGKAGGAGGAGSIGWTLPVARSATAGGATNSGSPPSVGNAGTSVSPAAETVAGLGGLGGGGGGGSPGVGGGASAATGAGGAGGDGAAGGPGEIEIWAE